MRFEPTRNYGLIRGILTHPAIFRHVTDDAAPAPADFRPNEDERIIYLLAWDGAELLGLVMFVPQGAVCLDVHVAFLPTAWGERAHDAMRGAVAWAFVHTGCARIVGAVAVSNPLAIAFAKSTGFAEWGRNPSSFLKNGKLRDVIHLGISRKE
jgi:RimJ/RimL family protein N-acetyltransferase